MGENSLVRSTHIRSAIPSNQILERSLSGSVGGSRSESLQDRRSTTGQPEAHRRQRPLKSASRFSMNAATPSRASSLEKDS